MESRTQQATLRSRRAGSVRRAALPMAVALLLGGTGLARAATDPDDETPEVAKPAEAKDAKPAEAKDAKPAAPKDAKPAEAKDAKGGASEPTKGGEAKPAAGPRGAVDPLTGEGPVARGLSWDLMAGGIPSEGALLEGELGFSGLPRVAYHYSITPDLSLGAMASFDFAYWAPERAFSSSILLQAPIRIALHRAPGMSVALRLDPGVGFFFEHQFTVGILANAGATVGWTVDDRLILGAGIDVPLNLWIPTGGADAFVSLPLLVGPIAELHVTPPLALTFDLKAGPHITAASVGGGTVFGFRMMAGVAYRL